MNNDIVTSRISPAVSRCNYHLNVSRTDGEYKAGVWAAQLPAARPHEVRGGDKVGVRRYYLLTYIDTISTYFLLPRTHFFCTNQTLSSKMTYSMERGVDQQKQNQKHLIE